MTACRNCPDPIVELTRYLGPVPSRAWYHHIPAKGTRGEMWLRSCWRPYRPRPVAEPVEDGDDR